MTNNNQEKFPRGIEIVGAVVVEDEGGKILLIKSPKWGEKWTMPGGHVEVGEKIEDAMVREAEEETGLKLQSAGITGFGELINSPDFHRPAHFIYFDVLCKTIDKNIKLDNVELTDYIWVDPQEALKMDLGESYDKTVQDYLKFKKSHS